MKNKNVVLYLKVDGQPPKAVSTSIPVTLKDSTGKMIAISNKDGVELIKESESKRKIITAWNGWSQDEYEVVWDGTNKTGLTKSSLPDQKGLLMGDYASVSATKQIMDHCELMSFEEEDAK